MRPLNLLAPALTALVATPALGFAVQGPGDTPQDQPAQEEQQAQPEHEAQPPLYLRVEIGPKAIVRDPMGVGLGAIHDHVVERATGRVLYVVVEPLARSEEEERVLVPFRRFALDATKRSLVLRASAEELSAMPSFDPDQIQTLRATGTTTAVGLEEASAPETEPVTDEDEKPVVEGAEHERRVLNLLASRIVGARVLAKDAQAPFGSVRGLLLDPKLGTLPFALIHRADGAAADGELLVAPWAALQRDPEGRFALDKTIDELAAAPAVTADELLELLRDEQKRDEIYRFYGVTSPARGLADDAEAGGQVDGTRR